MFWNFSKLNTSNFLIDKVHHETFHVNKDSIESKLTLTFSAQYNSFNIPKNKTMWPAHGIQSEHKLSLQFGLDVIKLYIFMYAVGQIIQIRFLRFNWIKQVMISLG